MSDAALLEVEALRAPFHALSAGGRGIFLRVEAGERVAIVGANGAGKTTLLNMITGYTKPASGAVRVNGRSAAGASAPAMVRLGVARTFQVPQLFESLTVRASFLIALAAARPWRLGRGFGSRDDEAEADRLVDACGMSAHRNLRDVPCAVLPHGERKIVDVALGLACKPRLLLLDEPTSGVGAEDKHALMDRVFDLVAAEAAVLFVEHDVEIVQRYARRVVALDAGEVLFDGQRDAALHDPRVRSLLGLGDA